MLELFMYTVLASGKRNILDIVADDLESSGQTLYVTALVIVGVISILYVGFKLPKYLSGRGQDNDLIKIVVGAVLFCVIVGSVYKLVWG